MIDQMTRAHGFKGYALVIEIAFIMADRRRLPVAWRELAERVDAKRSGQHRRSVLKAMLDTFNAAQNMLTCTLEKGHLIVAESGQKWPVQVAKKGHSENQKWPKKATEFPEKSTKTEVAGDQRARAHADIYIYNKDTKTKTKKTTDPQHENQTASLQSDTWQRGLDFEGHWRQIQTPIKAHFAPTAYQMAQYRMLIEEHYMGGAEAGEIIAALELFDPADEQSKYRGRRTYHNLRDSLGGLIAEVRASKAQNGGFGPVMCECKRISVARAGDRCPLCEQEREGR